MSLSSRNPSGGDRPNTIAAVVRIALAATGVAAAWAAAPASAAEYYYQPVVQLATAYNTNLDLSPLAADKRGAEGYYADAATTVGIATPTSETTLQPRLLYNYYPSASDRNRLEAFLNGNGRYTWQRDHLNFFGTFDHRDDVNAEQPGAADNNTVNPGTGTTTPTTGRTLVGVTRDYLIFDPTYTHLLTPLSGIGLAGEYQRMSYSESDANHVGFNYGQVKLFYSKTLDLRSDFSVGVLGSHYEASFGDSHSNSGGIQSTYGYNWSQVLHSNISAQVQETRFRKVRDPGDVTSVTSHPWAAMLSTVYDAGTVTKYTLSLGRTIYPSSAGGLYQTDQVRGQYDRDFTPRLHFTGALRVFRDRNISGVVNNDYRNYATASVRGQYMLSQRIFVAATYTHAYQKYRFDPASAEANVINVSFGYRGLERQH